MVLLSYGGDVTLMTLDDNKSYTKMSKKNFTLRLNVDLSEKVEREADSLGLTQNAYITMILHKAIRQNIS